MIPILWSWMRPGSYEIIDIRISRGICLPDTLFLTLVESLSCDSGEEASLGIDITKNTKQRSQSMRTELLGLTFLCNGRTSQPSGTVQLCFWTVLDEEEVGEFILIAQ